ncbi:MAG: hypothetical protein O6931_02905 [Gammaproteobacteria bacterium]|nr:hypothetical protein [Gammaproteobacteria bacterium]
MHAKRNSAAVYVQLILFVALGLTGMSNPSHATNVATYKIKVSQNLRTLDVSVTPSPGYTLSRLRPLSRNAWSRLNKNSLRGLAIRRSGLVVATEADSYHYSVDIGGGFNRRSFGNFLAGNKTRMTDSREWFWVPDDWQGNETISVEFDIPDGLSVSAPWEPISNNTEAPDASGHFLARPVMLYRRSAVLFGRLQLTQLELPGGMLNVAVATKNPEITNRYVAWTKRIADAAVQEFGHLPATSTQVVVMPTWSAGGSVPWGEVRRGNGSGVVLVPNTRATMTELIEDWTFYHEFAHLFHPFLGSKGRWIAEGFASYYQNILRARAGVITADYAWERMVAGFARGEEQTRKGRTVVNGGLMRTYWTGAVMALELDIELRKRRGMTLGNVLGEFSACCLPASRTWRPRRFMQKLDEISDTKLFTKTYREYSSAMDFPDYSDLLHTLDIRNSAGSLAYGKSALRDSIMHDSRS